ncbi:MAG TPA: ribose-phosphate diphosphokinase [Candidatus Peribacterales bacterium]|nr:ribose-phosphate diphosphokinase [Candidatus Peribacterales bacterium]
MKLFSGSSHRTLAEAIAKELGMELGKVELQTFSCGEQYVRYEESVRGQDVFIIQTGSEVTDSDIIELCLMCQAAKLGFAKSIHLVIPHFPYARQDRVSKPREPISAKLICDLLVTAGANHVITLALHTDQIQGFSDVPMDALKSHKLFAEYFTKKNLKDLVVVSPDAGGTKAAKIFADSVGADLAVMHKTRPRHNEASILHVVGEINGKTAIIYDDMIDTAGSICAAKEALIQNGVNKDVYVVATHAIFSGSAVKKLTDATFKEVVVSDSLPLEGKIFPSLTVLSIAPMLARVIGNIMKGESVTEMYN